MTRRRGHCIRGATFFSSLFIVSNSAFAIQQYSIKALDPSLAGVTAVNSFGQITGNLRSGPAYVDLGTGPVNLGLLPGDNRAYSTGINDHGMVSGVSRFVDPGDPNIRSKWTSHAISYENGTMTALAALAGGSQSTALGLNDAGKVVGWSESTAGRRAALWDHGSVTNLGTLPGDDDSYALGIDENGRSVGLSLLTGHSGRGVTFQDGTVTELPTLNGAVSAYSVLTSRNGLIAGVSGGNYGSNSVTGYRSWILQNGHAVDLGTFGNSQYIFAGSVNDSGVIVGYAEILGQRAFVYDGAIHDLNNLIAPDSTGWQLNYATSVNNAGQIVGNGLFNGVSRAFIATPVPEPAPCIALGLGALATLRRRRRS